MGGRILPMPSDVLRRAETKGETVRLLRLIQRKVSRGKSLAEIADELEDSEEAIRPLYEAVQKYGADCAVEEVYEKMSGEEE